MIKTFLIIFAMIINSQTVFAKSDLVFAAETATKSATPTPDKNITELKERIATQVARLKIIKKRGILGKISDLSNNQLILIDIKDNKRFVDVDELTKFKDIKDNPIGISDLKKNNVVEVIGLYNTESKRLLARFIQVVEPQDRILGQILDLDAKNFTMEVITSKTNDTQNVEVEKTTKTQELVGGQIEKSGFSQIRIDEKILAVGFLKDNSFTASRILLLPDFSPDMKISTPTPTATPKPKPTKAQ